MMGPRPHTARVVHELRGDVPNGERRASLAVVVWRGGVGSSIEATTFLDVERGGRVVLRRSWEGRNAVGFASLVLAGLRELLVPESIEERRALGGPA